MSAINRLVQQITLHQTTQHNRNAFQQMYNAGSLSPLPCRELEKLHKTQSASRPQSPWRGQGLATLNMQVEVWGKLRREHAQGRAHHREAGTALTTQELGKREQNCNQSGCACSQPLVWQRKTEQRSAPRLGETCQQWVLHRKGTSQVTMQKPNLDSKLSLHRQKTPRQKQKKREGAGSSNGPFPRKQALAF